VQREGEYEKPVFFQKQVFRIPPPAAQAIYRFVECKLVILSALPFKVILFPTSRGGAFDEVFSGFHRMTQMI